MTCRLFFLRKVTWATSGKRSRNGSRMQNSTRLFRQKCRHQSISGSGNLPESVRMKLVIDHESARGSPELVSQQA